MLRNGVNGFVAASAAIEMEFCLLGPLVVRCGGTVLTVPTGKQRVLLAALLLSQGRMVLVDELAELLWASGAPPSARVTVQNYVKRLRQTLGETGRTRIDTGLGGYRINLNVAELDVSRLEAMLPSAQASAQAGRWDEAAAQSSAALALWRGEPLEDVDSEPLKLRVAPRLAQMRLQAAETRIDADLHLGRHAEVITDLTGLTRAEPLRERLHSLLMLALYRCGRRADALATYQAARRVLIEEVGTEPGPELRDLHKKILAADPTLTAANPAASLAAGIGHAATVPQELPGAPTAFTGRKAELGALTSLLTLVGHRGQGTVAIGVICGAPGVGKTALAVSWAHQVADQFPDGQLFVSLRGYDPASPMTPATALAGFLRALGIAGPDIPASQDERARRYRSLVAGRRMLIVLDNAGSAEQVRPLLPGSQGCLTIVTSRSSLAGLVAREGATRHEVDLLPLADAICLLRSLIGVRVGTESDAAATLARQCARLPLALRVAAERAAARPDAPLAELVDELADQQQRLDRLDADGDKDSAIREVFSWSCRQLDADTHRAFRLAGLHPGGELDCFALAALTGYPPQRADRMLESLARACLVQRGQPGRYGLHDLLRAYARELATAPSPDNEPGAALARLFDYYLHATAAAMDVLVPAEKHRRPHVATLTPPALPAFPDTAAARAWLEPERASLVAVAEQMSDSAWADHAIKLATILFRHFQVGGHYAEAVALHGSAFRAAAATGDHAAEAAALINLGAVRVRQGDLRQANEDLQQALGLARRYGDRTCAARALHTLGNIGFHEGRFDQAAGYYEQALTVYRQLGDLTGEARTLNNLGSVDELTGRYQQAAEHYGQGLALYRQAGERVGEARALANLGSVCRRQGRYRRAVEYLERSVTTSHADGDRYGEAHAVTFLGDVHQCEGRYEQAAGHYQQALTMFGAFGDRCAEAVALNGLGETLLAAGHSDAHEPFAAALELASQTDNGYEQARAHHGLARAYQSSEQPGRARHHWQRAFAEFTRLGTPEADQVQAQIAEAHAAIHPDAICEDQRTA